MFVCMFVCVCMYVCVIVCMYVCMYVYPRECMGGEGSYEVTDVETMLVLWCREMKGKGKGEREGGGN